MADAPCASFKVDDVDAVVASLEAAGARVDRSAEDGPHDERRAVLRDPAGEAVDALGYGSFGAGDVFAGEGQPAPDPPAGESLARLFANADSDDNASDFIALATPTPGTGTLELAEPSVLLLLGTCLAGLAFLRRVP